MKKKQIFGVSICLLLSCVSPSLTATLEEDEELADISESKLPPLKILSPFCALKMDDGPCKANMPRYFFNILTQQCEEFIYGGCGGNQNRFDTIDECKEQCTEDYPSAKRAKKTLLQGRPDFCFLGEDVGLCRGFIPRYFYNHQTKHCEKFVYGGCLGNLNNFKTKEDCKNTCEDSFSSFPAEEHQNYTCRENNSLVPKPTKVSRVLEYRGPSWCLTPADRGLCRANETRFYFDISTKDCLPFTYSGCGGNENNFTSKTACIQSCKKGFFKRKVKGLVKTKRKWRKRPIKIVYEDLIKKT